MNWRCRDSILLLSRLNRRFQIIQPYSIIGLTNVQKASESKPGSRDWKHFRLTLACKAALETIRSVWGWKFSLLSYAGAAPGVYSLGGPVYSSIRVGNNDIFVISVLFFSRPRWTYFLHLSLSSVILIDSSTESPVHVLMLSIQAVRGLPRLCAPGIVPCIISFSRQLPCHLGKLKYKFLC